MGSSEPNSPFAAPGSPSLHDLLDLESPQLQGAPAIRPNRGVSLGDLSGISDGSDQSWQNVEIASTSSGSMQGRMVPSGGFQPYPTSRLVAEHRTMTDSATELSRNQYTFLCLMYWLNSFNPTKTADASTCAILCSTSSPFSCR